MIAFICDHRAVHGFQPDRKVLPIAPSTYRAHLSVRRAPERASVRVRRETSLRGRIRRVFDESFQVYGAQKVQVTFSKSEP